MSQTAENPAAAQSHADLAPFEIWEVMLDNSTIKFHQPLMLQPEWLPDDPDEPDENEYLSVKMPELAINVYAENFDDLLEAVHSAIRIAWRVFVRVPDDRLIPSTKEIQQNYLAIAEEIDE